MARGDALYARCWVDWPLDPRCVEMSLEAAWLNHVLWLLAVKERRERLPARFTPRALAAATGGKLTAKQVEAALSEMESMPEPLIIRDGSGITVKGVSNHHQRITWRKTIPHTGPIRVTTDIDRDRDRESGERAPARAQMNTGAPACANENARPSANENAPACVYKGGGGSGLEEPSPPPAAEDPDISFPVKGSKKPWTMTADYFAKLEETYPHLHVRNELRKAWLWIDGSPARRKTSRGMKKFISGWMGRAKPDPLRQQPTSMDNATRDAMAEAWEQTYGSDQGPVCGDCDQWQATPPDRLDRDGYCGAMDKIRPYFSNGAIPHDCPKKGGGEDG